jgi:hypothetical protein
MITSGNWFINFWNVIKNKITIFLALKSRVVTVGIGALGPDPEDH